MYKVGYNLRMSGGFAVRPLLVRYKFLSGGVLIDDRSCDLATITSSLGDTHLSGAATSVTDVAPSSSLSIKDVDSGCLTRCFLFLRKDVLVFMTYDRGVSHISVIIA